MAFAKIIDLPPEHEESYFVCLEEWPEDMKDAGSKERPEKVAGQVTVTAFTSGWCPAQNITLERAKRAAAELGEKVVFEEIDTFDPAVCDECGRDEALFIDDKQVWTAPPLSYRKIKRKIEKRLNKIAQQNPK